MPATSSSREGPLEDLARAKLVKVLGPDRGHKVYCATLREMGLASIDSADTLHAFGEHLIRRGGIEAAVGAMLGVSAVVRGAAGRPPRSEEKP
ncbi:MAG TPA: hypothetical protein VK427_15905 [Kofleriaceae bacterium]|nr:hypothetical protein [Kofleriaceae bacterium]